VGCSGNIDFGVLSGPAIAASEVLASNTVKTIPVVSFAVGAAYNVRTRAHPTKANDRCAHSSPFAPLATQVAWSLEARWRST
jgi:hypothetical protein